MAHEARANVNMEQQTTAALMRLNVPYLKNYMEGFPFGLIDLDISMYRLQRMFDHDPELHEVLHNIRLHLSALVNRYSVILLDGTTFLDTTGRNGAEYHCEDWEDDEQLDYGDAVVLGSDEVEPVSQCIKDCMFGLEELSAVWAENLNMLHAEFLRDQVLREASVDLARRLNRGVQRLLNAEIVPLVYLLREEMLDQEHRLKMKKGQQV